MNRFNNSSEKFYLTAICLISFVIVLPIAYFGIPSINDLPQHFRFAQIFHGALVGGDGFPNFAGNENFGYGDIGIRFYPPLAYYALAFFKILRGNWYDAAWLSFALWMIVGSVGIYLWSRCWLSPKMSAIASLIYLVIPFHLNQLYTGYNNYAELAATGILTLCFAFLTRVMRDGKTSDVAGLAIFYALLILSHIPLALVGSIGLFLYCLTFLRKDNFIKPLIKCAAGIGLGLSASAFYWIVVVSEISWLAHNADEFSSGHFDYSQNFFPTYFYQTNLDFFRHYLIADLLCLFTVLFFAAAVIYPIYKRKCQNQTDEVRKIYLTILPLGLFAFFMMTFLSRPLWEIIPLLKKIQFPIRWMPLVAMCGTMVAAASVHYLIKGNLLKNRLSVYGLLILLCVLLGFNFIYIVHPLSFVPIPRQKFEKTINELPETESFQCWWAIWSQPEALKIKEKAQIESRSAEVVSWRSEERIVKVSEGTAGFLRLAVFYYPHWKATVNNQPVTVEKDKDGALIIPVPAESSTVEVKFEEPFSVKSASIISLITWLFFAGFFGYLWIVKRYVKSAAFKLSAGI